MFKMTVQDSFSLSGLGMVAVGRIEDGSVKVGDTVELISGEKKRSVQVL
jgi:elongation factor Tu